MYKENYLIIYDILHGKNVLGNILLHNRLITKDDVSKYIITQYSKGIKNNID